MKRDTGLLAIGLCLAALGATAQKSTMDEPSEKRIHITQGPDIVHNTGHTAVITWTTSATATNHVKYRVEGGPWRSAYQPGGSTRHSLELTGLEPGRPVEWQIMTRDGDIRTSGHFRAGGAGGERQAAEGPGYGHPGYGHPDYGHRGPAPAARVPIYRADNPQTGQHLYTTNQGEIANVQAQGWRSQGVVGVISSAPARDTAALFRIYIANGDHFYTTSQEERNAVLAQGGRDEGVVGYVARSQQPGTAPVHRMVSTKTGMHFYSANAQEVAEATMHQGYRDEGVIGYLWLP
ncbi:MAG TPA: hypothetical protein VF532_15275 [Candidatus Angelobacter sp.]